MIDKCKLKNDIDILVKSASAEKNTVIAIEEMAELTKELTKRLRYGKIPTQWMTEEIADVIICLMMVCSQYEISDENVEAMIRQKMERNLKRIRAW